MLQLLTHPALWVAIICLGCGMAVWLMVLYQIDVSKALPFISLGQLLVLVVSKVWFHEHVSSRRWCGALLIAIGTALVAQT